MKCLCVYALDVFWRNCVKIYLFYVLNIEMLSSFLPHRCCFKLPCGQGEQRRRKHWFYVYCVTVILYSNEFSKTHLYGILIKSARQQKERKNKHLGWTFLGKVSMHNYYNNGVDSLVKTVGKWNFYEWKCKWNVCDFQNVWSGRGTMLWIMNIMVERGDWNNADSLVFYIWG